MNISQITEAFRIYNNIMLNGKALKSECTGMMDNDIEEIVDLFANESKATIIGAGDYYYFVPLLQSSANHMSNEEIKKFLPANSNNIDIYMMYLAIIVFVGEFYNSYNSSRPTRDFLTLEDWLSSIDERLNVLGNIKEEELEKLEQEYSYNWLGLIDRWNHLDIIKEDIKEKANTRSRRAFLGNVIKFMIDQELIEELGNDEYAPSIKLQVIVSRFFMDSEFNKGILDLLYQMIEE